MASHWDKKIDSSAIVEMEVISGDDSDYETNFSQGEGHKRSKSQQKEGDFTENIKQNVASYMLETGKQQAKRAFSLYGNIDILRPYFNVEPQEVRERLIFSLIPKRPGVHKQTIPKELYGPLMVVFTLIALLLYQMKSMGHTVQEGTLMGTSFAVCFGYWLGVSSLMWFLSYVCSTHITVVQILSLLGYALCGHCIVLFIGTVLHSDHDHIMFYLLWAAIGGLSTLKMVAVLVSRTEGQKQKLIVCGVITVLHLLFLLYLHFAYHRIVEDISQIVDKPVIPHPIIKQNEPVLGMLGVKDTELRKTIARITKMVKIPVEAKTESLKKATLKVLGQATHVAAKILGSPTVKPVVENLQNQAVKAAAV